MVSQLRVVGCLMVVITVLMGGATAATYTVGNNLGWTVPPLGSIAYRTWANQETFQIGDTLIFNWNGTHNVAKVSKDAFDNCTTSANPIEPLQTTSPANFTLNANGTHYFICTVSGHCNLGQKVAVTIGDTSAAPSLATGAFSAVLLLALVASFISN